jgi:hypothetical protein
LSEQRDYGKRIGYAAVWTDENLIEKVLEQAENFMGKLQAESKVKLKIPILDFITYEYDYKSKGKHGIYFDREVDLSEKIRVKTIPELYKEIQKMATFKPFIAQIEQNLILALHLPKMFREQLMFLRQIPEISAESKKELDELIALPDPTLQQKVLDSEYQVAPGQNQFAIIEKHVKPLISRYPTLRQDLLSVVNKEKPTVRMSFRGGEYITYFLEIEGKPEHFPVCFPIEAKYSLPHAPSFHAKVLGIVSFTPNPPLDVQGFPPFFLRAVSLFLPYHWKETPRPSS